jgi:hypothetical protein
VTIASQDDGARTAGEGEPDPFDDCLGVHVQANARRLAAPATPAAWGEATDYERAYFERGFIAAAAWALTKRDGDKLSDAVIDHAWAHRDEGMDEGDVLPVRAPALPPVGDATEAQPCAGEAWQPIETAPYDRMVLVDCARFETVCEAMQYRSQGWRTFGANGPFRCDPIAWREKPARSGAATPPGQPEPRDPEITACAQSPDAKHLFATVSGECRFCSQPEPCDPFADAGKPIPEPRDRGAMGEYKSTLAECVKANFRPLATPGLPAAEQEGA